MSKGDGKQSTGLQFGIRHAFAAIVLFAGLFFVAKPRYPPAPTISVQRALNQLQANNIESAVYYSDHNFAYLTTKVQTPIGENQQASLVRVSDPDFTLTSELEAAGVPWSVADDSPTLWILCFGTALIVAMGCIGRVIIAQRWNRGI